MSGDDAAARLRRAAECTHHFVRLYVDTAGRGGAYCATCGEDLPSVTYKSVRRGVGEWDFTFTRNDAAALLPPDE